MNSYHPPCWELEGENPSWETSGLLDWEHIKKTQRKKLQDAASTTMINPIMELLSRQAQQQEINKMF